MEIKNLNVSFSVNSLLGLSVFAKVFEEKGLEEYKKKLKDYHDKGKLLPPGPSMGLARAFASMGVSLSLISKISVEPELMLLIARSLNKYMENGQGMNSFEQVILTGGKETINAQKSLGINLSITTNKDSITDLHRAGISAFCVEDKGTKENKKNFDRSKNGIVLISDFDGVIADRTSEEVFQRAIKAKKEDPVKAFAKHEYDNRNIPMLAGPMLSLVKKVSDSKNKNIDLHLLTARSGNVLERAFLSLAHFDIKPTQMWFMAGMNKNIAINQIAEDNQDKLLLFLDDGDIHYTRATQLSKVLSGLVSKH